MPARSSQNSNGHHAGNVGARPLRIVAPKTEATTADPENVPLSRDLEGLLSGALLAGDKELRSVLREVDGIAKALRSGSAVDSATIRVAVHPAVWSAVRHTIVERELRYLALTDDLTCLYNRRGFFAAATQQLKLAQRNRHGVLLFFCDVDNLKQINDSFGHREGDLALVRAANALESAFRDSDVLARLGGDEFAVLALEASPQDDRVILRRLEEGIKKSTADEPRYVLSLSVGVARFDPQHAISLGDLMQKADLDMYEQKRNRPKLRLNAL